MSMTTALRALPAALAILAIAPAAAAGQRVIPPDNGAVNQYTETFPTTGGDATSDGEPPPPEKVLGRRNAERLESLGPEGRAAAALAAKTAPPGMDGGARGGGAKPPPGSVGEESSGSSVFGEIVGQATGSSGSGEMGLLLPLVIVAAVVLSGVALWRRRDETA
jgi:hypothetical protein